MAQHGDKASSSAAPSTSIRPRHIGHVLEWTRTACAFVQIIITTCVLLRAFGVL
jgi:hypothetical protein